MFEFFNFSKPFEGRHQRHHWIVLLLIIILLWRLWIYLVMFTVHLNTLFSSLILIFSTGTISMIKSFVVFVYVNLRQENHSLILIWTTCWRENLQYILMIFCRCVWLTLSAPSGDSRLVTAAPPAGLHTANWILVLVGFFRSNGEIGKSGSCEIFLDFFFNDIPNHSIFHTLHWNYIDIIDGNKLGYVFVEDYKRQKWFRASNSN